MSIGVKVGTSTADVRTSSELHTYIRHLKRKIDDPTTVVERDRHVRDELAKIKHLLQISPSHSTEGRDERRSQCSPPRSHGGGPLVEHPPRPSAKDRLNHRRKEAILKRVRGAGNALVPLTPTPKDIMGSDLPLRGSELEPSLPPPPILSKSERGASSPPLVSQKSQRTMMAS
ncbi:hypothetical protein RHMOL_Rhmol10G0168800 [Rhododendron molle]|uniref:Uncharacterized protein n=1 Tax=Rhododendron molle TaxID=49168 RepID=A0ACC0M372_RHOML|nr:hypothetical protein RHMOL_Rhmol10G0168800 [Rhododendron molle]